MRLVLLSGKSLAARKRSSEHFGVRGGRVPPDCAGGAAAEGRQAAGLKTYLYPVAGPSLRLLEFVPLPGRVRAAVTASIVNKDQLLERLRGSARPILDCGVERLELFGSFVRDEGGPESDVDLLVEFRPGEKTYDNLMALSILLEELLGHSVELVTRESLSPYLGPSILSEAEDCALRS